jgi:hypothetical protein
LPSQAGKVAAEEEALLNTKARRSHKEHKADKKTEGWVAVVRERGQKEILFVSLRDLCV